MSNSLKYCSSLLTKFCQIGTTAIAATLAVALLTPPANAVDSWGAQSNIEAIR